MFGVQRAHWMVAERRAMRRVSRYRAMPVWRPALRRPLPERSTCTRRFVRTRPSAGVLLMTMHAGFALTGDAGLETGVAGQTVRGGGRS